MEKDVITSRCDEPPFPDACPPGTQYLERPEEGGNAIMTGLEQYVKSLCTFSDEETRAIRQMCRIRAAGEYADEAEVIKMGGVTIGTAGNFSASVGKPKSKKTFNVSAIAAAALSGRDVLAYRVTLPPGKPKVLYVDTEQGKIHCRKVVRRISLMAGAGERDDFDNLEYISLKEWPTEKRCDIISSVLDEEKDWGLVIIDGIRDLIRDINNGTEAIGLINRLMCWSGYYKLHIHMVLHLNKSDDNTRGHIGSELENKSETVLQLVKRPDRENVSEVRVMHSRDVPPEPFAFELGEDHLPHMIEDYIFDPSSMGKRKPLWEMPEEFHRQAMETAFDGGKTFRYSALLDAVTAAYTSLGYTRGRVTIINTVKCLVARGVITKKDRDYSYNPEFAVPETASPEENDDEEDL